MNSIIKVDNPMYNTKQNIRKIYKGYHVIITNMAHTPKGEPYAWIGGTVRFYSNNLSELSEFMRYNTPPEYEDTMIMYTGDKDNKNFSVGGIMV